MRKFCAVLVLGYLSWIPVVQAQDGARWAEAAALPDVSQTKVGAAPWPLFGAALAGQWVGTLTYRDFRSDKQVVLPVSAGISGDSGALRVEFVYDDGPGKTVRSSDAWGLDAGGGRLRMDKAGAPMAVSAYRAGDGLDMTLVALGDGVENDQAVQVREVLQRRGGTLSISRSTQLPGKPWLLRHIYQLTLKANQ